MPKRTDIKSVLIIGAGPIVIGQACEFDYSGAQACKALKEEGYRVILVNSNPATIMTDPETADAVYIEPVHWTSVARVIEKERPDALLPTMGGQTGLNCALDLVREGILEKYKVELIAASRKAIDMAEDREQFRQAMKEIGLEHSVAASVTLLDSNGDGLTDRVYFADTGGNVWRVDLSGNTRPSASQDSWYVVKLIDVNGGTAATDRRFFNAPDVVRTAYAGAAFDAILIGSGDRTNPNDMDNPSDANDPAVDNQFYMLRDEAINPYFTAAPASCTRSAATC